MTDSYVAKGLSKHDAELISSTLVKYPKTFIDETILEESGMQEVDSSPWFSATMTFVAYVGFGLLPILPYILPHMGFHLTLGLELLCSALLTLFMLFALGVIRAMVADVQQPRLWSGCLLCMNGLISALWGYFVGFVLWQLLSNGDWDSNSESRNHASGAGTG